jgi:hypothetical protein
VLRTDRYIVSQPHVMRTVDIVRGLRERFPGIVVPDGAEVPLTINIDSSKVCWALGCREGQHRAAFLQTGAHVYRTQLRGM